MCSNVRVELTCATSVLVYVCVNTNSHVCVCLIVHGNNYKGSSKKTVFVQSVISNIYSEKRVGEIFGLNVLPVDALYEINDAQKK
jgi:hypothetical protein